MNQEQKRSRDQAYLNRFLALQGISPETKMPGDHPLAFALDLGGGRRVGVEFAGVDDEVQRHNKTLADRYLRPQLTAALREKGHPIRVYLAWKSGPPGCPRDPERLSELIARLMAVIDREAPSVRDDEDFVLSEYGGKQRPHEHGLPELSLLSLATLGEFYSGPGVDSLTPPWGEEHPVVAVLRKKEAELPEYRRVLGPGELWLILVTSAQGLDGNFFYPAFDAAKQGRHVQSLFDRVFLMDARGHKVASLK